jgi:hypothetical protein
MTRRITMKSLLPQAVLFLLLFPLGSPPANAQYTSYGSSFSNPVTAQCNTNFWSGMGSRGIYRMILKKHGYTDAQLTVMKTEQMYNLIQSGDYSNKAGNPASQGEPAAKPQGQPAAKAHIPPPENPPSRFKPTAGRLFLPDMVKSLTQDAEQQKALLEVFEAGMKGYESEAKKSGLTNDVAGSMAFFIGCAYLVYRDGEEPNEDGLELLARALQYKFNTDEFRKIAKEDKQKFYELMIALGTYLVASRQTAVNTKDAAFGATIKEAAAGALKGFLKMDPARFKITANGVETVK